MNHTLTYFQGETPYIILIFSATVFMLLVRFAVYFYVSALVREAERMGKSRSGFLKKVRREYDKELLLHSRVDNIGVFVECALTKFSAFGVSMPFAEHLNMQGIIVVVVVSFAGVYEGMQNGWVPERVGVLCVAGFLAFTVLVTVENLIRIDEKLYTLQIRIVDYLENDVKCEMLLGERLEDVRERRRASNEQRREQSEQVEMLLEELRSQTAIASAEAAPASDAEEETQSEADVFLEVLNAFLGEGQHIF